MKSIHAPNYQQLVKELTALRETRAVTQTQLAERLGKPQSYVAKVENLDRRLDVTELADWLEALRTPPCRFMERFRWWR